MWRRVASCSLNLHLTECHPFKVLLSTFIVAPWTELHKDGMLLTEVLQRSTIVAFGTDVRKFFALRHIDQLVPIPDCRLSSNSVLDDDEFSRVYRTAPECGRFRENLSDRQVGPLLKLAPQI